MTKNKTLILSVALLTAIAVLRVNSITSKVYADGDCVTQYGGSQYGTNCAPNDLVINKEVQKIGADDKGQPVYVENLSTSDTLITAGNYMTFKLTVKNNSGHTFSSVEVKDIFPPYMKYVSGGPSGTVYDAESRTMTSKLENMIAGESRQIILTAQIVEANSFPSGQATFCIVNTAQARSEGRFDEDTAQVCLKQPDVKGATTLPKAGFNDILLLAPVALLAFAGTRLMTGKNK